VDDLDARKTLSCGYGLQRTGWTRGTDLRIRCSDARRPHWVGGIQRCIYDDRPPVLSVTDAHVSVSVTVPDTSRVTAEDVRPWRLAPRFRDAEHWSQGSAEAHRMATGPPLGRRGDAESIEGNRFISPTHTGGA
jgi:hypothetical protein